MRVRSILLLSLLSGCTTELSTYPIGAERKASVGIPYSLPALHFDVVATRSLVSCEVNGGVLDAKFEIAVVATPSYVEGENFVADYRGLSSSSKITSVRVDAYENHTLKTVNAEADDKGPEIAAGVAQAGFAVARMALGVPSIPLSGSSDDTGGGAGGQHVTRPPSICPAEVEAKARLTAELIRRTKVLASLNRELEPLVVQTLLATLTEADKDAISQLRKKVAAANSAISDVQKKIEEYDLKLSYAQKIDLDLTSGTPFLAVSFPGADAATRTRQAKWLAGLFGELNVANRDALAAALKPLVATLRSRPSYSVDAKLCQSAGLASCAAPQPEWDRHNGKIPTSIPGIAFRQPVSARLRICEGADAEPCAAGEGRPLFETLAAAPQMGRLMILPFRNGFGANNQLQAQFRADGSLEYASYSDKRASGLTTIKAVNSALSGAGSLSDAIIKKRVEDAASAKAAAEAASPLATAKQQLDLAKTQAELFEVQGALDPSNIALKQQQAAYAARVEQLTSLVQIKDLEAKLAL